MRNFSFSIMFTVLFCAFVFGQQNRALRVLEIPLPPPPVEIRNVDVKGSVILRIEFLANGQIGRVSPVKSLEYGLTEDVIEYAKKIKFEPKVVAGTPINTFGEIHYLFSWSNPGWKVANKRSTKKANVSLRTAEAEAVLRRASSQLGGDKYLQIKNSVGRGRFSLISKGIIRSFQSFLDVIVYPNKERTDFKEQGSITVRVNFDDKGWIYLEHIESLRDQTQREIFNFKRGIRAHYNYLLGRKWVNKAALSYVGKRRAGLGVRNDVVKLSFTDGFEIEYEFSAKGLPMKTIYSRFDNDSKQVIEEDRYARFIDIEGVLVPHVIDRYSNDKHAFRVSYESFKYNTKIPDSIFDKPANPKKLKKKLKL